MAFSISFGPSTKPPLAGLRVQDFADDPVEEALFQRPTAIAADGAGNPYVADQAGNRVRLIALGTRQVSTLASSGEEFDLVAPAGLAIGPGGVICVSDSFNQVIRAVVR